MTKKICGALLVLMTMTLWGVAPALAGEGTFLWSGRVDDKVEVVVSGRIVSYRRITGNRPTDVVHRFSETMPSQSISVRLNRRSGRGSMRIVESPNRSNGYATVIRIEDSGGGSDKYGFELRWNTNGNNGGGNNGGGNNNGNWNGNGGVGRNEIRWSGRVDGTDEIRIQRSSVSWSKVDGSGASDVKYRVGSPLPVSSVRCSVNKRQGRGLAFVRSQPDRNNNFTAIIRVVDNDSGSDSYDFSVRW